ncbi:MAG: elongation factor P--(R)-beta-lysine ligase [Pseudomonadota bacterium]|jgi:elongation factor P--(R)-beta-lysine ligase|uniref:elongation factor P--(R)-beta-lysine ligase n=1 Tax=Halopseudomonas aestusnigri TaxID=857252 RepID=UPI000E8B4EB3|nr:elongation factor P--(R)-beta-lysine ligase [Pseudomonadota bacterium]HBT58166.1 elongation factor P lysine(34) lysyltransferase [Pseudomonas sp.]|tara:strand:+ start:25887 stop:26849 length:963 start_codon:yes stop_codon:yes gene_type:complete
MNRPWQPSATIDALRRRAGIINRIREFFAERGVLEVDTPSLSHAAVSDPFLHPFATEYVPEGGGQAAMLYLHTSPEYPMKRLLAAGSGAIWQLCKVYRNGEIGRRHNPEFSMLEWYRPGFDHHQLMDEVDALVRAVLAGESARRVTYAAVFAEHTGLDIHQCSDADLQSLAAARCGFQGELSRDGYLNLLFSECVEPRLQAPTLVYAFPASQAALARVVEGDDRVPSAARFEMFVKGMELANGYFELTDADEQLRRFEADQAQREALGIAALPIDMPLVDALRSGMPSCAGVALGVDRLVMLALGASTIGEVIAFDTQRA